MLHFIRIFAIVFLHLIPLIYADEFQTDDSVIVLVPHGEDPQKSKDRIVIPRAKDGLQPPLPCVISDVGMHEHGQTFTKGNFHYTCNNGIAEVIGATCFENGIHYDVGESFRNGSFKVICREDGVTIQGCYVQDYEAEVIPLGGSKVYGSQRHSCELLQGGKIRYIRNDLGCRRGNEMYKEGQVWTDKHIRYQCTTEGTTKVLGCVDEGGLFVDLGRDILMQGIVHRCYKLNNTTIYHRFQCDVGKSLQECVNNASVPSRVVRSDISHEIHH